MAAETGNVPLSTRGTVVGIRPDFLDVLWDVGFIGGTTLGDRLEGALHSTIVVFNGFIFSRCSEYRGLPVMPWTVLNLTKPQFMVSLESNTPAPRPNRGGFAPRARGNFTPAPNRGQSNGHVRILQKGHGRGGFANNFGAAARGEEGAYAPRQPVSHRANLRSTLTNGYATANGQTYENNIPPSKPLLNYHAVPPPAALSNSSRGRSVSRGGARLFNVATGQAVTRSGSQDTNGTPPTAPASFRQTSESRGRGNTRGRGRGRGAFVSEPPINGA